MGFERLGSSTTRDRLHHRRLHFKKAALIQKPPDFPDDRRALLEDLSRGGIGDQIEIPLAITRFRILNTMPFVRQGAE